MRKVLIWVLSGCLLAFTACKAQNPSVSTSASATSVSSIEDTGLNSSSGLPEREGDTQTCYSVEEFDFDALGAEGKGNIRNFSAEYYIQSSDVLTTAGGIEIQFETYKYLDNTETLEENYFNTPPEMATRSDIQNSPLKDGYGIFLVPVTLTNTSAEEQEFYLNKFNLVAYPKEGPFVWQSEPFYRSAIKDPKPNNHDYAKVNIAPNETITTEIGFFVEDKVATYSPIYLSLRDSDILPDSSLKVYDWFVCL